MAAPMQLPHLPKELWMHIFSFLLLSQKQPVVRLSKYHLAVVTEQTRSAIDLHYKKLLTLFINTLGEKYVGTCVSFRNLLLTNLIPPEASNLNLIRNHLDKIKHTIAVEFLTLEENEKQRLTHVVDAEEGPRLRELFKLTSLYHQVDEHMDKRNLAAAEKAALQIKDKSYRSTKLIMIVNRHIGLDQFASATRVSQLIPDPKIQTQSLLDINRAKASSIVYNPAW